MGIHFCLHDANIVREVSGIDSSRFAQIYSNALVLTPIWEQKMLKKSNYGTKLKKMGTT